LLQIIIMSIPKITALSPEATAVPLICVLAATGIKDAADDIVSLQVYRISILSHAAYDTLYLCLFSVNQSCTCPLL